MKKFTTNFTLLLVVLLSVVMLGSTTALAVTKTSAGTGNWTTITWSPAGAPGSGDDVIIAAGNNVTFNTSTTVLSLTVNSTGTLTMGSSATVRTLTVSGSVTNNGTIIAGNNTGAVHVLNIGGNFTNNGTYTAVSGTGSIDVFFNGTVAQSIGGTTATAFDNITISNTTAAVTATNSFSILGTGLMTVSNSASFDAGLFVVSGTGAFTLAAGGELGIGDPNGITLTAGGTGATAGSIRTSTRTFTAAASYIYNGSAAQVTGSGLAAPLDITINNAAGVTLTGTAGSTLTATGQLTMTSGTLNMANINLSVAALTGSGNLTHSTGAAGARTLSITGTTSPAAYTGVISNGTATSVAVTKSGTGTLTLSGLNSYTGLTTISAGTIKLGAAGDGTNSPLGTVAAGTTVTATGAALDLNGFTLSTTEALTLNGTGVSTAGALTNSSLTAASFGGLITLGSASTIATNAGDLNVTNAGTITGATFGLTLGGSGNGSIASIIGTTSGTVTKSGTGTWTVSGASTYTGNTTISAGILKLGASGGATNTPLGTTAAGTFVSATGGALDLNGFTLGTVEALSLNGTGVSSGGALTNSSASAASYSGLITLANNASIVTNAGDINVTNAGTITGAGNLLTLGGSGNGSVTSIIGNTTGGVTKSGAGAWTLSGANTYSGATTISAGTLKVGVVGGTIPNASAVSVTGILDLNGNSETIGSLAGAGSVTSGVVGAVTLTTGGDNSNTSYSGVISDGSGTVAVTKAGTGTWTVSGLSSYTGLTTISAGTMVPGAAGDGTNSPFGTIAGGTTVSNGAMLDLNGVTLSTAEPLTLNGTGITSGGALGSTNAAAVSYSGLITLGSTSSIVGSTGTIAITNPGTITGAGFGLTLDGASGGSVASIIGTGAGAVAKAGAGTWTLSGVNTYTGVTTLSAGVLSVGTIGNGGVAGNLGQATNAAANLVLGGGTLQYTGATASTDRNYTLTTGTTSTIDITTGGTNLTISGVSTNTTGALTKIGAGTLTLSGANLYTGLTTVSAGTLAYGASNALSTGNVTVGGGTFDIGAFSDAVGTVTLTGGTIAGTSGVLTGTSYAVQSGSVSAILGGAVGLTKTTTGTVTLSGLNTYTGATTISAGTLSVNTMANAGSNSALGTGSGTPAISIGATGILKYTGTGHSSSRAIVLSASGGSIDASGTDTLKLSGGVTGTGFGLTLTGTGAGLESGAIATGTGGTVTKSGTGSWTFTGSNTYTGITTVGGGVLVLGSANALPGGIGSTGGTSNLTINGGVVGLANGNFLRPLGTGVTAVQWLGAGGFAAYGADRIVNLGNASATVTWNSGSFVLSGDTLVLSVPSATNMIDFQNPIAGTVARTILVDNQAAAIEGKLSGVVSGTGSFVKLGSGLLQLPIANTLSGGTTLSEGTLTLGNTAALGAATNTVTINGGTLDLATNTSVNAYPTTVNGTGTIVSNRTTSGAGVIHTLGTLSIGLSDTLNVTRGSAATGIAGLTFGATTLSASTPVFNTADSVNLTLGAVGGAFAMTKQGVGKMTLATASTRITAAGITNLNAGTLRLETANALNTLATAPLNINGGTLSLGVTAGATYGGTAITMGGNGTIESDRLTAGAGATQVVSSVATNAFQLNVTSGSLVTSGTPQLNVTGTLTVGSGGVVSPGSTVVIGGAAGTLTGNGTAQVTKTGAADDFTTQYTINAKTLTNLTIEYAGGAAQTLNNALVYNGLKINNAAGVTLGAAKTVNGALTVASGTLTTGANVITLGTSATLSEAAGQTVLGTITTTRNVSSTSGTETFGNIGSDITLHGFALNGTTVTRTTGTASTGAGNPSIKRYFDITPTTNTGLNADLLFHYDDSELNGQTEASLLLYKSTNTGSTWSNQSGTVNTTNNTIAVTGVNDFSRWTASALSLANNYTLNITAVNGSVAKNPDQATYTPGTSVQLTATPATGYHFVNWTGDTTSTTNPLTVTMYANKNITANFAINTYTLTINATNGSVAKNPNQATYNYGTSVQLTPTGDPGYHFWKWTGDTSGTTNPLTVTMYADKNITANFILDVVTKNWTGATSTDWNNAANWSPAEVPSSDDPVTIFSTTNKPNVNANGASAAIQIFSGGRLDFNTAGTTLTVNGNFEMIGGSTVSFGADATLDLKANLQTDHNWFPSDGTQGTVRFSGAGDQLITGEPFPIKTIEASSGGTLVTFVNVDVDTLKMLSNNFQLLDNGGPRYIKVRGDIIGAGASRYIMTTSLATGGLTRVGVGSGSPVLFPVGTSNSYNPFSIQTGTGTDDFTVRVINSVSPTSINNASAIQRTWSVTEATPGGNGSMTAAFTWNGSEEGGSINAGNRATIASWRHDGSTWAQVGSTTVTGSGPYTATTSGLTNFSNYTLGLPGALSYTITASAGAHGSIAPAGITYLASGANQSYTITADAQYHIDSVFVDGGYVGAGATYDFTNVTANHTINAVFVANVHTITSSAGANGSISPLGATSVNHGDSQSFTITPNTNYHVANVLVDGSSVGAVTSYNFTNVIVDHTISATFAIDTYTITAAAHGNGTIDPSGAVVVNATSNQSFTIAANANHHIDSVVVDGVNEGALASRTFTNVLANHTIDAYFSINTFTLTYTAGANGSITGTTPQTVNYGTDGSAVTAVPAAGYHFVNWSDASTSNPRTDVNVTADISVTANFAINTYTLTYTAGAHGSLTGTSPQTVNHGSDGSAVTAVPDAGYHFVNWSDASTSNPRTDVNVQGNISVTANFAINTYTITATAGANGSITPSGAVVVNHGSDTTFTITPATGYHIDSVFVDGAYAGVGTSHTFTNVVADGHTISATFAINTYTLTYTAGANGSITGTTPQTVNYGTDGSAVTAVPATGYHFVNWSDASTANPRTDVNVTANISVTANFAINTYTLTYTAGAHGSISGTSPQTVNHGADGSAVTAVPDAGYHFVNWSDASTSNPRTDVNVTADISVTANFAINTFTLTYTAGANGSITGTTPQTVNYGTDGSAVTAVPAAGYHFVNWSDASTSNPRTDVNVTADISVTANFAINTYTLTYTAGAHGSLTGTSPQTVNHGSDGSAVTAVPDAGYHFVNWSDASTSNPRTDVNVQGNISVTANFAINTYTITATAGANGSITPSGAVVVNHGSDTTFTITPATGYHIDSVFVDGAYAGVGTSHTFTNVVADGHTISATFAINTYTLTYTAGANGSITGTTPQTVNYGTDGSAVTAVPAAGYHFVNWSDASTANPRTDVNVTANISVTANFAINTYTLTYTAGAHGSISGTSPQTVNHGADGSAVTAVPDAGYHFVNWSDASTSNPRTDVNVTADISVTANFAINTYTITATAGANGSITPSGAVVVNYGADTTFTIAPATGYHILDVVVDGSSVGAVTSHTFTNVVADGHTISVTFAINTYTLNITAVNGSVLKNPDQATYDYGTSVQLTATGASGYHLLNWSGDASGSTNPLTVVMNGNKNDTANFIPNAMQKKWIGAISSNWSNAGNWSPAEVPSASDTALIAPPVFPLIANPNVDADATCDYLQILFHGKLDFNTPGVTLTVNGNFDMDGFSTVSFAADATLNLKKNLQVDHNWFYLNPTMYGTVRFSGTGDQVIHGEPFGIKNIEAASGGTLVTFVDVDVDTIKMLSNNFLLLDNGGPRSITLHGDIVGAGSGRYIMTNGTGGLKRIGVGSASPVSFPVGTSSSYNPFSIQTGTGTDDFTVRVINSVSPTSIDNASAIQRTWSITEGTPGGNGSMTATFEWNGSEGTSINGGNRASIASWRHNGSAWAQVGSTTVTGSGPYTATTSGLTNFSNYTLGLPGALSYTITASAGANGSIAPAGISYLASGGSQSYTITADAGYHIADVQVDGGSVGPVSTYDFTGVTSSHTISATFAPNVYAITASAGANGAITPSGSVTVNAGTDTTFTFTPNTGYHVDSIFVDGVSQLVAGSYTFTNVTATHTIHVSFAINTYTITASAGANGSITPSGAVVVNHGSDTTFTIAPATGYHIDSVFVDGAYAGAGTSHTFTNVVANGHTINVKFAINTYTLTYTAGANGSITGTTPQTVNHGADGSAVTAVPAAGYHFVNWSDASTANPRTDVNVQGNISVTANFAINTYTLTYTAGANGSITGTTPQTVNHGADGSAVTAVPAAGYHFVNWSDASTANPRTDVNVTANISVTANFAINTYTITASAGANGSITPSGAVVVNHGSDTTFTIAPATGYHIDSVFVDGAYAGAVTSHTFTNVVTGHTISVKFAINTYTLTYTAGANGSISGTTPQTVNHGADGSAVTAVPAAGYHFVNWSDASTANPRTDVNVTANISVTANFAINTYTLTYTAGANGSITGTTPQTVNHGADGSAVTAVPAAGYHFVNWSDASTANPRTDVNVQGNISVTANFAINTYTLTYTAGANGSITGTTPQTVNHGADGSAVTAVPAAGYHFVNWSDASTANPRTDVNVTANISVTANFAINTYTLTYTAGANGSISGTTPQTVNHGADGSAVTAVPAAGYHFVNWSDASTANPRTDVNVQGNISVTANFAIDTYTLTYTAGANGSITGTTPQTVNHGADGSAVTAVPAAGYHFVNWSDASTANPRTDVNVTANISVTANFAINTYTLTYTAGANGSITGTTPQTVNHGADGSAVTAVPAAGYHFVNWSDASTANPRTDVGVTSNISVTANFAINTYTLTYTAGANGSITGTTPQTVNHGADGSAVTAVPAAGYHFVNWSDASTANPRTDVNVTANISVTANFAINTYTITASAGANGSITPSGAVVVNHGSDTTFTIAPATGYHIDSVFVDGAYAGAVTSHTFTNVVTGHTISVKFAINTYTLTYTAGANGSISGTTPQTVNHGADGSAVTAVPAAGYHFVNWSDASTANPRTDVNVTANISVTANFAINTYTLTYTAGANGSITGTTPQTVNHGADGSAVTAVPAAGYHFVNWSDASTANPRTDVNVQGNISVTANFAINTYTLTYTAGANGSITGTTPQTVNHGADGSAVTAVPAAGYHFVNWSDASTANPRTDVNVTANISVTANFAINTYTLTYTAGANGSISGTTPQTVNHGADGSAVTAVPAAGYHFVNWSDASTANPRTDVNVQGNISVTANFAINTYTLTYTAGANGSITGTTPQTVNHGADGSAVTAVPAAGYHFVNWSDASTANPRTDVNVTADISVTANFAINTYTLTYTAGANGSITGTTPQTVNHGADGSAVTAVPAAGYHFVNWSDASTANPRTDVNVQGNISVTANFAINTYTLTYTAGANGSITGTTPQTVNHGADGSAVTAVPAAGYHFVNWSDASTANPRTDVNVTADISVTANFAINTYTLTYTAGANGSITGTTPQTVNHGADGSAVTAVADAGYHFVNWSDASTANPRTDVNVTANISVTANFAINTYTLTYTAGANGSITGTTPQTVNHGADGSAVTAVPAAGYHFVNWSDASTANPRTDVNVTANISVTANFAINTYTLTYTAGANGSITGTTPQTVNHGADGSAVTAVADAGYHFVNWSDASTANPRTDVNVTADISVTANFAINTYTLTYTAGANGSITGTTPQTVNHGADGSAVTAVPAAGYHFVNWSDTSTANPRTDVNVTANISVTANFAINTYTLTYTAGANGSITGTTPQTVNHGADGSAVTAVPAAGYHFVNWSDASTANPRTDVNVTANISVTANFAINTYTITSSASANGQINPLGATGVNYGGNQSYTITVNTGYHIDSVVVDGVNAGAVATYDFTNVTVDHTIGAYFSINSYTITASAGANGTIAPAGVTNVNYGDSLHVVITPAGGYQVATLKIDGVGVVPSTSYTFTSVAASHTIAATFTVASVPVTATGTTYTFDNDANDTTDMTMNFSSLTGGGGSISVTVSPTVPPSPPAGVVPYYLEINSTIPNHTFSATTSIDMFGVAGFGPSSYLMYYSTATTSWVMVSGTYLASDVNFSGHPSFTFTTDHFTTFAFINTASTPKNVYVSSSATSASPAVIYPNTDWTATGHEPDDWAIAGGQTISVYLVPEAGAQFGASDITLEFPGSNLSLTSVSFGTAGSPNGLYSSGQSYPVTAQHTLIGTNRVRINATRLDNANFTTAAGDYIAKLTFTIVKPGHTPITVIGTDFRFFNPSASPSGVYVMPFQAEVKAYLGDIAAVGNTSTGDGKVDFNDLAAWSLSYWSGTPGFVGGLDNYKVKYDFGPTQDHYVFSLPVPDTKIDFEDLVIFAISYGLSSSNQLPRVALPSKDPVEVSLGEPVVVGNETRIPVKLAGSVNDVRGMKLEINGQFGSFLGVEKGSLLQSYTTPVMLLSRANDRNVYVDFAIVGLNVDGINEGGEVVWLRFSGDPHVRLSSVEGRTSNNSVLNVAKTHGAGESVPTTYNLMQNYPNPFNPTTTIQYEIPTSGPVSIEVYGMLGERVATLVNTVQEAGFYQVQWNGRDDNNNHVASGVYLYRINAGKFSSVKKMLFLK